MTEATSTHTSETIANRRAAVAATVSQVRDIETRLGVSNAALAEIKAALIALAARKELFSVEDFPNPELGQPAKLYVLSEDPDGRFPLYLTCAAPGGSVRPHNHGVWAAVAGLSGIEENRFFARTAGGHHPGPAEIVLRETVQVGAGEAVSMLPDDIHSVATPGDEPRRHFHMYGLSLERLPKRLAFDMENSHCDYMEINPKITRVSHA